MLLSEERIVELEDRVEGYEDNGGTGLISLLLYYSKGAYVK